MGRPSQGVLAMEDSAMLVKAKFTAKPGEQFVCSHWRPRPRRRSASQPDSASGATFEFSLPGPTREELTPVALDTAPAVAGGRPCPSDARV